MERAQVFSSRFSFADCWHWVPWINSLWAASKQSAPELGHSLAALTLTCACIAYSWSVCPLYKVCVWRSKIALIRLAQILIRCNHSSTEVCPGCPPSTAWGPLRLLAGPTLWVAMPRCQGWQLPHQRGGSLTTPPTGTDSTFPSPPSEVE